MKRIHICAEFKDKKMAKILSIFSNELHALEVRGELKFWYRTADIQVVPFEVYDTLEEYDQHMSQSVGLK